MDLVGERLGQGLVTTVDRDRDGGMLAQQIFDAGRSTRETQEQAQQS
jgi:hypothetical protein